MAAQDFWVNEENDWQSGDIIIIIILYSCKIKIN